MKEKLFPLVTKHLLITPKNEKNILEDEWSVCLKNDGNDLVGNIHFEDSGLLGGLNVSVDIEPSFVKKGYDAEIFASLARFIFQFKEVREISTVCRHEYEQRVRGLEKAGYVLREFKDGSDYYSIKKQKTSWTGAYVIIGMCAGFMIGITISNLWLGTIAGILIGAVIGYLMDKKENND